MKTIEVTIDKHGKVQMEVQGAIGQECKALTAPLERALGGSPVSTPKPELFQSAEQGQQVTR